MTEAGKWLLMLAMWVAFNALFYVALTARTSFRWRVRDTYSSYRTGISIARGSHQWMIGGWREQARRYHGRARRKAKSVVAAYERTTPKEVGRD